MIKALRTFFRNLDQGGGTGQTLDSTDMALASAALMVEVMMSDGDQGTEEKAKIHHNLRHAFGLSEAQVDALLADAKARVENSVSLFEFTDQVNRKFSLAQKAALIQQLWKVAYADTKVHKLEEATIRKIAELIHLPHSEFIRAKQTARAQAQGNF